MKYEQSRFLKVYDILWKASKIGVTLISRSVSSSGLNIVRRAMYLWTWKILTLRLAMIIDLLALSVASCFRFCVLASYKQFRVSQYTISGFLCTISLISAHNLNESFAMSYGVFPGGLGNLGVGFLQRTTPRVELTPQTRCASLSIISEFRMSLPVR